MVLMLWSKPVESQVNTSVISLRVPGSEKTVEIRVRGTNSGNDLNLLRDSTLCYPMIFTISNPLDREIQLEVIGHENKILSRMNSVNSSDLIRYEFQFSVPARQTISRLTGFPLAIKPAFPQLSQKKGQIRSDGLHFTAKILGLQGVRSNGRAYFDFDFPNLYVGNGYRWSDLSEEETLKNHRSLLICSASVSEQKDIKELKDFFSLTESWSLETLPSSVRPLSALHQLILYGVEPDDLAKSQRDSIVNAVQRGLRLYLIAGSNGSGLNWNQQFPRVVEMESSESQQVGLGEVFSWSNISELNGLKLERQDGSQAGPRNLADLGVRYLDKKMRPADSKDLTLILLGIYVLILIPVTFGTLKKRGNLKSLLWLVPLTFACSTIVVTLLGVGHFGVIKKVENIGGVIQDSTLGLTKSLQVIESVFDPRGGFWSRTLSADEDLLIDYESTKNYRSIRYVENEDGSLEEILETYPRSLNFRIRSIPLNEPRALLKAALLLPKHMSSIHRHGQFDLHGQREEGSSSLNAKISEIADSEILDRFGIDPELPFIGLEGSK